MTGKPAVVLLSGGIDSATTLAVAQDQGHEVHALTFRYGQRHHIEVDAAARIAQAAGVARHTIIDINLAVFGGSALTDPAIDVPTAPTAGIPATYVPARNTIFLAYALAYTETAGAGSIWLGCNADDERGYPDCRPQYLRAFEDMAQLATGAAVSGQPVRIVAPLLGLTKPEVVAWGRHLGVDYTATHSCYRPDTNGQPCGVCDACRLRDAALETGR